MNPPELLFAPTHEWVRVSEGTAGKVATVGLSAFALEQLSDLVFLALPEVGATAAAGQSLGEIESVKSVSDIYAPVSGPILEVNKPLADQLETLSGDPFGAGWLVKIQLTDEAELTRLLDQAAYDKQCAEEH